jgi:hypothetical protein
MLAESKAMGADGLWAMEENLLGDLEPKKKETSVWMEAASADFSRCFFQVRRAPDDENLPTFHPCGRRLLWHPRSSPPHAGDTAPGDFEPWLSGSDPAYNPDVDQAVQITRVSTKANSSK